MKKFCFMAFAKGKVSEEVSVKRYIGVGGVQILAINPTREEQNKIYGSSSSNEEIKYVSEGTAKNSEGKDVNVPQVRITFLTKTDPKLKCNNEIETIIPVSFFLKKSYNYSNKNGITKVQVIDAYGRTAWATAEELKAKKIPEFTVKSGPHAGETRKVLLDSNYRPCYLGEEALVNFLREFICIPNPNEWNNDAKVYVTKTGKELAECECMFENVQKFFTGDVSELKQIVLFQPNNRVFIPFGVRTDSNGTLYQCAYSGFPMRLSTANFDRFKLRLDEDKKVGRHPSEKYSAEYLKLYEVSATDYANEETPEVDPFASAPTVDAPQSDEEDLPFGDPFETL